LKSDCIKTTPATKTLFEKAIAVHNSESPVKNALLCSIANKIYATLCDETDYASSFDKQKVNNACSILAQNIENPNFTCEELAKRSLISEVHLRRLFSKVLGVSPMQYLLSLRFSKAEKLLENNELTVSQIAIECGFADIYYFSKAYKKHFGHSPKRQKQ
jgi:transcriptional regulator GlxA family with amidase domain